MKLKLQGAIELNNALNSPGLKAKHVGAENFMDLINDKVKLKKALGVIGEKETEVAQQLGVNVNYGNMTFESADQATLYNKMVKPFHDEFEVEIKTHFIPIEELKEYTKEQDTSIAAILFEHLLKASE